MKRLRIAVLCKINTGAPWILLEAREMRRRGHEVVAILPPGNGRLSLALAADGFEVVEAPFDFRFRPNVATVRGLWRLRRLVQGLGVDVLHYHFHATALAARLATIGLPLARVYTSAGPLYLESRTICQVERVLWRLDDVTLCSTADISRRYGRLGCPERRRPVAHFGIDLDRFTPTWLAAGHAAGSPEWAVQRAKARAEIGIDEDAFVAVMVSYVYAPKRLVGRQGHKGHELLLAAWRSFHARHPRSHLLLVGAGWTEVGEKHRQKLLDRFDVAADPSITWAESVLDVRQYYGAADVSLSPSLSEAHGAAREAGAMGIPSIVSDAGGLPETVDARSGWVVPRGDEAALEAALETAYQEFTTGRLAERGGHARRRAAHLFDGQVTVGQVVDILEYAAEGVDR